MKFLDWNPYTGDMFLFGKRLPSWYEIRGWFAYQVCRLRGHRWREYDVDPENGCQTLQCLRCGETHETWW